MGSGFRPNTNPCMQPSLRKWAVVQYDNRPLPPEYLVLQERTKRICTALGHDYYFFDGSSLPDDMPPYWQKVRAVQDILKTTDADAVMWLDTDATLVDERAFNGLLPGNAVFVLSSDTPRLAWGACFCAGVWGVRNSAKGKELISKWLAEYEKVASSWSKVQQNGKTVWKTSGAWAGVTYEQGNFTERVWPLYAPFVQHLPWQEFQTGRDWNDGDDLPRRTLHFAGKEGRLELCRFLLTN